MAQLVHELVFDAAARAPAAPALEAAGAVHSYAELAAGVKAAGAGLHALGVRRGEPVAAWLDPGPEPVQALFGAAAAGALMVPLPSACGERRAAALLRQCGATVLVTSGERLARLAPELKHCPALRAVVAVGTAGAAPAGRARIGWDELLAAGDAAPPPVSETDPAALLCRPGVPRPLPVSHRELVAAAAGTVRCLGIAPDDRVLAALPLQLDFGLNQLASAFAGGAAALVGAWRLRDLPAAAAEGQASVLAALPQAWAALARRDWTGAALRCAVSAGGAMPPASVDALRRALPRTRICLLYGLAEAFRATCLAPGREAPPRDAGSLAGMPRLAPVRGADETIRISGRRVSPRAVEQVVYGTGLVEEAAAVGVAHPVLGQVIAVLATPRRGARLDSSILFGACRARLPGYMLPAMVDVRRAPLPRSPNGKIDRALLAGELAPLFAEATP